MAEKPKVIRDTDADSIRLAKTLIRTARFGALAALDPSDGTPIASRVGVATDLDGTPLILVSMLATHTKALLANPSCSLLVGEPGKGDPLAYPRISIACIAERIGPETADGTRARRRYLNRNPKAALYAGLGDFHFFRLGARGASLNGGFGKAYQMSAADLSSVVPSGLAEAEQGAIDHMNEDHLDAIQFYAAHYGKLKLADWRISGLDADGVDLASNHDVGRVFYPSTLAGVSDLRQTLVEMAKAARAAARI